MRELLTSKKIIISTLLIAIVYVLLVTYLMNYRLTIDTLFGSYSLSYKWRLLTSLLGGLLTSITKVSLLLIVMAGILTGLNLTLIILRIRTLRGERKLHVMVGGSSLLAIVGSGCAACGLPILALLGLSGSVLYLPWRGSELSVISVVLLLITLYFMLQSYPTEKVCKLINTKT